jgi:hypothetical protein
MHVDEDLKCVIVINVQITWNQFQITPALNFKYKINFSHQYHHMSLMDFVDSLLAVVEV